MKSRKHSNLTPVIGALLAAVVVAAVLIWGSQGKNTAGKLDTQMSTTTESPAASPAQAASTAPTPDVQSQILAAFKAKCQAQGYATGVLRGIPEIQGDAAQVSATCSADPSATSFVAIFKQADDTWTVVYEGQQPPGSSIGTRYSLPRSWYDASHE